MDRKGKSRIFLITTVLLIYIIISVLVNWNNEMVLDHPSKIYSSFISQRSLPELRSWTYFRLDPPQLTLYPVHHGLHQCIQQIEDDPTSQEGLLRFEFGRLSSFGPYTGRGSAVRLSQNGFYHDHEHGPNATRCFACRLLRTDWNFTDDIEGIHRELSPNCPFLQMNNESSTESNGTQGNDELTLESRLDENHIESQNNPETGENDSSSVESFTSDSDSRENSPLMTENVSTVESISGNESQENSRTSMGNVQEENHLLPENHRQDQSNVTETYHLWEGVRSDNESNENAQTTLENDQDESDVWRQLEIMTNHMLGNESSVSVFVENETNNHLQESTDNATEDSEVSDTEDFRADTHVSDNIDELAGQERLILPIPNLIEPKENGGYYETLRSQIDRYFARRTMTMVTTNVTQRQDTGERTHGESSKYSKSPNIAGKYRDLLQMGYTSNRIRAAITSVRRNTEIKSLETAFQSARLAKEEMEARERCKICLDNSVNVVFLPCGHLVSCESCGEHLTTCPICRKAIIQRVKIFMS